MVLDIKDNLKMDLSMVKDIKNGLINLNIQENGSKIKSMEKVYISGLMDTLMMVIGMIMIYTEKVFSFGLTEENIQDNFT